MSVEEIIAEIEKLSPEERHKVASKVLGWEEPPYVDPPENVWDVLQRFAGTAKGDMPEDLALNHDHYLYGTPKKQP